MRRVVNKPKDLRQLPISADEFLPRRIREFCVHDLHAQSVTFLEAAGLPLDLSSLILLEAVTGGSEQGGFATRARTPEGISLRTPAKSAVHKGASTVLSPRRQYLFVEASIELRQLRYFVAVAEELHFGRAAERLRMSQSPLSRAIREFERELDLVLFVRTTRRVELTEAGSVLLERSRRALAEIDGAIEAARRSARAGAAVLGVGYGPFSRPLAMRIVAELDAAGAGLSVRLDEEATPELLRRIGSHELAGAVVMASPAAPRYHGVRIDTLRDEPLLAALSAAHEYANAPAIPVAAFVAEVVMLPREPVGQMFNSWFRSLIRSVGFEVDRTLETISAPWDRRVLPVANGEAVCPFVAEWAVEAPGVVAVPFDPPLSFPVDFASCWPATEAVDALVEAALRVRDAEGWLTQRSARTELPAN